MGKAVRPGGLALALLFALSGCDGTPPASASTQQATVKGTVTRKGKPLPKVQVMFNPANINRQSAPSVMTTVDADGHYELTTLVGDNTISLVGPEAAKINTSASFSKAVDLKAGENTVDLNIP